MSKSEEHPVKSQLNEKVSVWRGDITRLEIDAIVNAGRILCKARSEKQ